MAIEIRQKMYLFCTTGPMIVEVRNALEHPIAEKPIEQMTLVCIAKPTFGKLLEAEEINIKTVNP